MTLPAGLVTLRNERPLNLPDGGALRIACLDGAVWITFAGSIADRAIVQALDGDATVRMQRA
jgi:hypothetical protein